MQATALERPRLPALTSVRFFAALWVALFHMQAMRAFVLPGAALRRLASVGYCGVSFFFVLSGFILVYTYASRRTRAGAFWQARFARIYPALAFALLVTGPGYFYCCVQMRAQHPQVFVPEWAWSASHLWLSTGLSLLLLESWLPQTALAWNMPNWSLSVEAFFYCVFPFLLPRMMRLSRRQLAAFVPVGFLVLLGCTLLYTQLRPDGAITPRTIGPWTNTLKYNPLVHLPEFLMGMATGLLYLRSEHNRRLAWPLVGLGMAATAAVVTWSNFIPYMVIHTALLAPAFAAFIYGTALRPAGFAVLEQRWMAALGEASYPFYLLHSTVIGAYFLDLRTGQAKHQTLLGLAVWLVIAVAIALAVDRWVERPLRRLLRPRRASLTSAAAPVAVKA